MFLRRALMLRKGMSRSFCKKSLKYKVLHQFFFKSYVTKRKQCDKTSEISCKWMNIQSSCSFLNLYRFLQNWLRVFTDMSGELWKLQEWMCKFHCRFLFFTLSPSSRINRNFIYFEGYFIWHPPKLPFVSLQSGAISTEVWIWMLSISLLITAL